MGIFFFKLPTRKTAEQYSTLTTELKRINKQNYRDFTGLFKQTHIPDVV